MKLKLILILICLQSLFSFSQGKNKIFVNYGLSNYPDMTANEDNFSISVNFIHQTKKEKWSMEYYYLYSQNDNFPSFYNDIQALLGSIRLGNSETVFEDTKWDKIEIMEIGSKVHYSILKNKKINLSANIGLAINYVKEFYHRTSSIAVDKNNMINEYYYYTVKGDGYYGAVFPGIHFDYHLGQNILLALDGGCHLDANMLQNVTESNTNFWNFSLGIGKKF